MADNVFDQFDQAQRRQDSGAVPYDPNTQNPFDQFDPPPKPVAPVEERPDFGDYARNVGEGAVTGIPNSILGLLQAQERGRAMGQPPGADILVGMFQPAVQGIIDQVTGNKSQPIPTPTSDEINKGLEKAGVHPQQWFPEPKTQGERVARMAGEGAVTMLVPTGNKVQGWQKLFQIAKEMFSGAAGGAGAQTGMEYAPDNLKPAAALVGGLLGGVGGVALTETPGAMSRSFKRGVEYFSPVNTSRANVERMAAQRLGEVVTDRTAAQTALNKPVEIVPGARPTSAQATGDVGLHTLERVLARSGDADFKDRLLKQREAQAQAQLEALDNVQASGSPSAVADYLNARMRDLEDQADQLSNEVRGKATKALDDLGDSPAAEIGARAREAVVSRLSELNSETNALWKSIPKDALVVTPPIMRTTARIYGAMSPEERLSLTPSEASIAGIIGTYEPTIPFDRFIALRSEISRAMRQAKNPIEPNDKAYARLSQLRASIEDAVADSVAGKVAEEQAAVAKGTMSEDDTLAANFLRQAKEWYAQRETGAGAAASNAIPEGARPAPVSGDTGTAVHTERGPFSPPRDQGLSEDAGGDAAAPAGKGWFTTNDVNGTPVEVRMVSPGMGDTPDLVIDRNYQTYTTDKRTGQLREPVRAADQMVSEPDRYVGGLSIQQNMETQGRDYVPTDPDMAALEKRLSAAAGQGAAKDVGTSIKAFSTEGRYGGVERAVDLEVNSAHYNPQPLWRKMLEEARDAKQDSVFLAREVQGHRYDPLKHRPAIELTFDTPVGREALDEQLAKLANNGVEFLTVTTGARPGTAAGAMPNATGVRMVYMPEFERRYGFADQDLGALDDVELSNHMQAKAREMNDLIATVSAAVPGVRGRVAWYDTDVAFGSEYGERLGRAEQTGLPEVGSGSSRGKAWRGQSVREGLAAADRHVRATEAGDGVRADAEPAARAPAEGSAAPVDQRLAAVQEGRANGFATGDQTPFTPEPQVAASGEPVPTKRVLREQDAQELMKLADAGDIAGIKASPHLADVTAQMRAIPETHTVADFASDGWVLNRKYATPEGKELKGAGPAITHLLDNARTLAATELGIKPYKVAREHKAVVVIGPPAAGKSTIANPMALELRAAIPDADEAKKIMPEYQGGIGASATHEESSLLAEAVLQELVHNGENLVIPRVGGKYSSIDKLVRQLKDKGYTVDVAFMDVPPAEAFRRMIGRFVRTGRLIPPNYFDEVVGAPTKVFAELKQKGPQDGLIHITSDRDVLPRVSEAASRNLGYKAGDEIQFAKPADDGPGGNRGRDAGSVGSDTGGNLLDAEGAERLKSATAATKAIKETYTGKQAQPVSGMLKRPGSSYPYDMPDEAVGAALWRPGAAGATAIKRVLKAAGDAPKARSAIEAAAVRSLRNSAGKDGVLDPAKFDAWKAKHADALNEMPDLEKRFSSAKKAAEAMIEIGERRKADMDKLQKTAIAKVLKVSSDSDVASTVGGMLGGKNSVEQMRELAGSVRRNPEALAGLRRAIIEHMMSRLTTSKDVISGAQFLRFIGRNSPALSQVFTPDQMNALRALAQDIKRATKDVRAPGGGSDTLENLTGQSRYGEERPSLLRKFLVDSGLGAGIGGALHIFNPGSPLINAAAGVVSALGSHAIQSAREAGLRRVHELVQEAVLDPELMKALLAKAPNKANKGSHVTLVERLGRVGALAGVMSAGAD